MRLEIAIEQLRDVVRRKHLAFSTEQNYAQWVTRFSWFVVDRCSPALLPAQKMELFLTQLARQDVSASTQNQAFCALLFFESDGVADAMSDIIKLTSKQLTITLDTVTITVQKSPHGCKVRQGSSPWARKCQTARR